MSEYHKVEQGECLSSIAQRFGFINYLTIYDHPKNAVLKKQRPNPNLLFPGDNLYIPDKEDKQVGRGTGQQHVFQMPGPNCLIRLRVEDEQQQPYIDKSYMLRINDKFYSGCTSDEGWIEQKIVGSASKAELLLWPDAEDEEEIIHCELELGYLDPVEKVTGVQARLNNLGFFCGAVDGILGPKTEQALKRFQSKVGLEPTGKTDPPTLNRLRNWHDTLSQ